MESFYEEDLAYIHHVGFGEFAEGAGNELLKIFHKANISTGLVIDLGCGSGIWAKKLTDSGYSVFGVDISKSMVELAQKIAPLAEFKISSLYDVELPSCVAITALGESLNYSIGELNSVNSLEKLFQSIFINLQNGGIFAFDIIVQSESSLMEYRNFRTGEDWAVLLEVSEQKEKNKLVRDIVIFRKIINNYRRSQEKHQVCVFNSVIIKNILENCGFKVLISKSYGNYQLAQRRLAYVAYKL